VIIRVVSFFLILTLFSYAKSSVWKVEKSDSTFYLGGTFHLLRASDFPLPKAFDRAYNASEKLVFETDIGQLSTPQTQQKMMQKAIYADGSTVDQHLSLKTYKLLEIYCQENGIPMASLKHFKPSMIMVALMSVELMKAGVSQEGVDAYFYQKAKKDGKALGQLESVDQQIDFLMNMGKGHEDALIEHTLDDISGMKELFESLIASWKEGDTKNIVRYLVDDFKVKTPSIYQELLLNRNNNWIPLIDKMAQSSEVEFVLVGAAHLVGEDGVLHALKKLGYRIQQLD
jgi:uncharacterized protein